MYFAEISDTGQIVVPVEIRKLLKLKAGDNILFQLTHDGEVIISNASASAVSTNHGWKTFRGKKLFQLVPKSKS